MVIQIYNIHICTFLHVICVNISTGDNPEYPYDDVTDGDGDRKDVKGENGSDGKDIGVKDGGDVKVGGGVKVGGDGKDGSGVKVGGDGKDGSRVKVDGGDKDSGDRQNGGHGEDDGDEDRGARILTARFGRIHARPFLHQAAQPTQSTISA